MAIIDMGDVQELVEKLLCEMRAAMPHSASNTAQSINAIALVAIAEQLAEANGYLADISKRLDQVYERTSSGKEMPKRKDCSTCMHVNQGFDVHPCDKCSSKYSRWEPA